MARLDVSDRYTQVSKVLNGKWLAVTELTELLDTSENYARKLVSDLVLSGNVEVRKVDPVSGRGRQIMEYTWVAGSPIPEQYTRAMQTAPMPKNTDPLILALYSHMHAAV